MHALADTGVPNRICPQKENLASTVDCPTGPNPVDFLLFFPTMPCFTKVKNGQKQWGCREWMAAPIFPVPAIRKPWLPPSAAYCKLVYRFFPSFPSQNASLVWLGFPLLLCSVLWAELIWLFKVFCKRAELYLSLSLSPSEFVVWNNRSRSIKLKHSLGCAQVRHKAICGTYRGRLWWMLFKCMLGV